MNVLTDDDFKRFETRLREEFAAELRVYGDAENGPTYMDSFEDYVAYRKADRRKDDPIPNSVYRRILEKG